MWCCACDSIGVSGGGGVGVSPCLSAYVVGMMGQEGVGGGGEQVTTLAKAAIITPQRIVIPCPTGDVVVVVAVGEGVVVLRKGATPTSLTSTPRSPHRVGIAQRTRGGGD